MPRTSITTHPQPQLNRLEHFLLIALREHAYTLDDLATLTQTRTTRHVANALRVLLLLDAVVAEHTPTGIVYRLSPAKQGVR